MNSADPAANAGSTAAAAGARARSSGCGHSAGGHRSGSVPSAGNVHSLNMPLTVGGRMPNVNPPADAAQAAADPALVFGDDHAVVLIGEHRESVTLPDPSGWRFVHVITGGRRFAGYL